MVLKDLQTETMKMYTNLTAKTTILSTFIIAPMGCSVNRVVVGIYRKCAGCERR